MRPYDFGFSQTGYRRSNASDVMPCEGISSRLASVPNSPFMLRCWNRFTAMPQKSGAPRS